MTIYLGQYILTSSLGSGFLAKYGNIQCTESLHGVGKNIPKMTHIECAIYPMKITETKTSKTLFEPNIFQFLFRYI
jgi:hypothetical protein